MTDRGDLAIKTGPSREPCDGCGRAILEGEKYLWGITSCCGGGCGRRLCSDCIHWALNALKDDE